MPLDNGVNLLVVDSLFDFGTSNLDLRLVLELLVFVLSMLVFCLTVLELTCGETLAVLDFDWFCCVSVWSDWFDMEDFLCFCDCVGECSDVILFVPADVFDTLLSSRLLGGRMGAALLIDDFLGGVADVPAAAAGTLVVLAAVSFVGVAVVVPDDSCCLNFNNNFDWDKSCNKTGSSPIIFLASGSLAADNFEDDPPPAGGLETAAAAGAGAGVGLAGAGATAGFVPEVEGAGCLFSGTVVSSSTDFFRFLFVAVIGAGLDGVIVIDLFGSLVAVLEYFVLFEAGFERLHFLNEIKISFLIYFQKTLKFCSK